MKNKLKDILDKAPSDVRRLRELAANGDPRAAELADAIERHAPSMRSELDSLNRSRT